MKKTIAVALAMILLIAGAYVFIEKKVDAEIKENFPVTIPLTTTEVLPDTTAKKTQVKEERSYYTEKEISKILYDYTAQYIYKPDVHHENVLDYLLLDNGKGVAVCIDAKKTTADYYRLYVCTSKDYGKNWKISTQLFGCEDADFSIIYIGDSIILLDKNSDSKDGYLQFSDNDGGSFHSAKLSKIIGSDIENMPSLYPEIIACDYEDKTFILGWKTSKHSSSKYSFIARYDSELNADEIIYKDETTLNDNGKYSLKNDIASPTLENCAEALVVLKNYALARPVSEECKNKILHYSMKENGKGVAVYGEHSGMHHVNTSILYTEDFGKNWQISNEFFSYTAGESKMLFIDDSFIFLNYNSVTFASVLSVSRDYGKNIENHLLSDLIGYKGATALSLYPTVKSVDEDNKTFVVDWHSTTDKKILLTQEYDISLKVTQTLFKDKEAIDKLIAQNENT